MKQNWPLILFFVFQVSLSQTEKHWFSYDVAALEKAIGEIQREFNVKYSYADSLVSPEVFTLKTGDYSLPEINTQIEAQTSLSIVRINNRYYALYRKDDMRKEELEAVTVTGFLSKGISKTAQEFTISPRKVKELPGVTDSDLLFTLQQLPGVKSPNETASGLYIRGGTPDENLILWDGIRMYHPGHLFGMISAFNPNIDQTVHYSNKASDPKFGERVSGVIDIRTTDKIADSLKISSGINALCADIYAKIPLSKKLGIQLSGRKSYTEWLRTPTFNALSDKVFQHTGFDDSDDNSFGFEDYSAKVNWSPNDKNEISVTGIGIYNRLDFSQKDNSSSTLNQNMDIENSGGSVRWNRRYDFGLRQEILFHYSAYKFDYAKHTDYSDTDFERFTKMNRIVDSGAEVNFNYDFNTNFKTEFGYQLAGNDISHAFENRTQELSILLDQRHLKNNTDSGYANLKYDLGSWNFQAGLRFSSFAQLHRNSIEPRLSVRKIFDGHFTWLSSFERKSQILSQIRESATNDLSLENYVWVLSDAKDYPIQKANQYTTGITYKNKLFLIDADAYYKTIDGITSLAFGFLHEYDQQIHQGNGFTKGFDLLVQKTAPTWRIWATYTFQDSQNRYDRLNEHDYFPVSSDIKHAFSISCFKQWNRFSVSGGWFWHTGKPYSLLNDENQIASFNSERLPVYHRMDVSAAYQFHQKKSWAGKTGISILNLYDRHSLISREYERKYTTIGDIVQSDYAVRDYYSLGFTPNIFVRFNF